MGRLPKPDILKKLQGTDTPSRLNAEQPEFDTVDNAASPDYFNELETKVWDSIVPQLIKTKLFQTIDQSSLVILCQNLATYHSLHSMTRGKLGRMQGNKLVCDNEAYKLFQIQQAALKTAIDLMKQYGFTPVARQKMTVPPDFQTGEHPKKQKILPQKPTPDVDI